MTDFHIFKGLSLPAKFATCKNTILGLPERGKTYAGGVILDERLHGTPRS